VSGEHPHDEYATDADLYTTNQKLAALEGRVAILEADAPEPGPGPGPSPDPPDNLQEAINDTAAGGTVDATGGTYSGRFTIGKPLTLVGAAINAPAGGTLATPGLRVTGADVTVRGVTVRGGFAGIVVDRASGSRILDSRVEAVDYTGIMALGGRGTLVKGCHVKSVRPRNADNSWNAYGIGLTYSGSSGNSTDCIVEDCTVEDVPTWHGLDTHAGVRCTFRRNIVRQCRRGIFLTSGPTGTLVEANHLTAPTDPDGYCIAGAPISYCRDIRGISVAGGSGVIRDNRGSGYSSSQWFNGISGVSGWSFSGNIPPMP
jgi:nitrous oxidase accessory protein NosD